MTNLPAFSIAHFLGRPTKATNQQKTARAATKKPLRPQTPHGSGRADKDGSNRSGGKVVATGKPTRTPNPKPTASTFAHLRPAPQPTEDDIARARAAAVLIAAEKARTPTSTRPPIDPLAAAVLAAGRKRRGEIE
jgi:hypothetical protein